MLPDGRVLIVNGATTGYSGYGNVAGQVGASNAANPTFRPLIYDPAAPVGQRFSITGLPTSNIPRLYHSAATLLPSGAIAITVRSFMYHRDGLRLTTPFLLRAPTRTVTTLPQDLTQPNIALKSCRRRT